MLDKLYENIGGKIKGLAKFIFVIGALGPILIGFCLLCGGLVLIGLCTMVCGSIFAWIGSWILYAFGELVSDTHAVRNKLDPIDETTYAYDYEEEGDGRTRYEDGGSHKKASQCSCGELFYGRYCPVCGKKAEATAESDDAEPEFAPPPNRGTMHRCKCGNRFYGDMCDDCGRTLAEI